MKYLILLFVLASCSTRKTERMGKVWVGKDGVIIKEKKNHQKPVTHRDILSTGDTLITTADSIYIIKK